MSSTIREDAERALERHKPFDLKFIGEPGGCQACLFAGVMHKWPCLMARLAQAVLDPQPTALPPTPVPIIATTGDESEIRVARDEFFAAIVAALGYDLRAADVFAQIEIHALGTNQPNEFIASDDYLHLLIVKDQAVASVLDRRNQWNYHEVSFACYLNPRIIERVRWQTDPTA